MRAGAAGAVVTACTSRSLVLNGNTLTVSSANLGQIALANLNLASTNNVPNAAFPASVIGTALTYEQNEQF